MSRIRPWWQLLTYFLWSWKDMRGINFYHASHTQIYVPLLPTHLEFGEGSREFFPYLFFSEQKKELSMHVCVCIFSSEGSQHWSLCAVCSLACCCCSRELSCFWSFFFTGCGTYKDHSLGGLLPRVFQFHKYMALSPPDTHSAVH